MKIAVIGDSTFTFAQGAGRTSVPEQLERLIRAGGHPNAQVCNLAISGMTWLAAREPTKGLMYGGKESPYQVIHRMKPWNHVIVCLGVNDRKEPTGQARMLQDVLHGTGRVTFVRQHFYDSRSPNATLVTAEEDRNMQEVYDGIEAELGLSFWALYDLGFTYDKLHPTDSGKHWLAASLYMGLSEKLGLTPLHWNIARLWQLKQENPAQFEVVRKIAA